MGALRAFKFARGLPGVGYEPHVACFASDAGLPSASESEALARMDVFSLPAPVDPSAGRWIERARATRIESGALDGLVDAIDRRMPVDSWLPWFAMIRPRLLQHARSVRPELVFCSGDPWSSLVLGRSIARELDVPFVADFRSPWTLGSAPDRERPSWVRAIDARAEAVIVRDAAALVFASSRARALYRSSYRAASPKMVTLRNGFDEVAFHGSIRADRDDGRASVSPRPTLDLLFFGVFRPQTPARPVVRWLAGLRRLAPELLDGLRVQSMGGLDAEDRRLAERAGVARCFESVASVPYEEALVRQRQADLLLISGDERRDDVIPSKLFDALAAGRPIVSLAANPEIAGILRHTGAGETADPDDPAWIARLAALVRAKEAGARLPIAYAPDLRALRSYEVRQQTRELASLFDGVLA